MKQTSDFHHIMGIKMYTKRGTRKFWIIMALKQWLKPKKREGLSSHQTIHIVPVKRLLPLANVPTFMTSFMTLIVIKMNNTFSFFYKPWWSICSQGPTEGYHSQFTQVHMLKIYFQHIHFNIVLVAFCIFCQKCCRCLYSAKEVCSVFR